VEVVIHQAVGVQQEMKPGDHTRQHREKLLPIFGIEKDILLRIPPERSRDRAHRKTRCRVGEPWVDSSSLVIQEIRSDPNVICRHYKGRNQRNPGAAVMQKDYVSNSLNLPSWAEK
jgi:hypothetical protein